ncbi:hypothetical protein EDC96DRAFT_145159 [Choanephora cucurbitarum]|nr:hypothetical protein EDC96DRAFT_145159 [Choanephora cucurbitarum]
MRMDRKGFPLKKKTNLQNRPLSRLQEDYKQSLIDFFDNDPSSTIEDVVSILTKKFANLDIKKSRVNEFMKNECNLNVEKASFWSEARTNKSTLRKRFNWVMTWKDSEIGFLSNYVFREEVGFDINMGLSRA